MQATNLKTNHLTQPLGIDAGTLFLSWQCAEGVHQTAYEIEVTAGAETLWASGKILSSMMHTETPVAVPPKTQGRWRIRLWDENDQPGAWSEAEFETGLAQYNTLKEKGFYSNIMGTSAVFSIFCDSIKFNKEKMEFTYYGRQRIERRSNILMRELVTAGQVKRVPRTENNPHGLLITNWRTLLNKDIEQKSKSNF